MANITLEAVEAVMAQAQAEYPAAKQALIDADGSVEAAVLALIKGTEEVMDGEYTAAPDAEAEASCCCEEGAQECGADTQECGADTQECGADTQECGADAPECDADTSECAQEAEEAEAENAGASKAKNDADELIEKLKDLVKKGNVDRIVIRRNEDVLLNIPVNVGLVGSVIGLAAAPWAVIAAAVAAFGFNCKVEIVKKDGSKEEV